MKRDESVFFFTLIDFLVQVLFFGLAFYTVVSYASAKSNRGDSVKIDRADVRVVTNWTWSNSIPELANDLRPLRRPKDDFEKWAEFISSHDYEDVTLAFDFVKEHGGIGRLKNAVRALGKPSCLPQDVAANEATAIARLVLTDNQILIESASPTFTKLSQSLGVRAGAGDAIGLASFRSSFQKLISLHPECRYFVSIREDTDLGEPKRAVEAGFLTMTRKR